MKALKVNTLTISSPLWDREVLKFLKRGDGVKLPEIETESQWETAHGLPL